MSEMENVYYNQLLEKINENFELKLKIEKIEKELAAYKKYKNFCKFFEYFKDEYEKTYNMLEKANTSLELIKDIFNKYLLLNPNFSNIKLNVDDKNDIIFKCRKILLYSEKIKIPTLKDFNIGHPKNSIFPDNERTIKKSFIVKK